MDPTGIYEVQVALMGAISGLWELWLGGTFALVVAFHFGRDSVSLPLVTVCCVLYLAATVTVALRYIAYSTAIGFYNQKLSDAGFDQFPIPDWFGIPTGIITLATFTFGTLAALYFAISKYYARDKEEGT